MRIQRLVMALGLAVLTPAWAPAWAAPRPITIDLTEEDPAGELGERFTGPPPDVQRPSLIRDKYRGVPEAAAEAQIDDPLTAHPTRALSRSTWLGFRLGGGMFDDSAAPARAGIELGLAGRYQLGRSVFAAARTDWSRRGGEAMPPIDAIGASAGLGTTVIGSASQPALALIGQLRGELRLSDHAPRTGLGLAVSAELALPSTPFTVGLRLEQGLTDLVPGARDRALLAELGVDLR